MKGRIENEITYCFAIALVDIGDFQKEELSVVRMKKRPHYVKRAKKRVSSGLNTSLNSV